MLLTEYRPHDITSLTLVKAQYEITPLHPPMLVIVVPRRALTCVSPDGERSVGFDILYCGCKLHVQFCSEREGLFCTLLVDRVYG